MNQDTKIKTNKKPIVKKVHFKFEKLDIYKTTVELLKLAPSYINSVGKLGKYMIGDKILSNIISMMHDICEANESIDKTKHLNALKTRASYVYIAVKGLNEISLNSNQELYLKILGYIESILIQCFNWKNYCERNKMEYKN